MATRLGLAVAAGLLLATAPAQAAAGRTGQGSLIAGQVTHVRDGDTIEVEHIPIRLQGVAAPERHERLGREAGSFLRRLLADQRVRCETDGTRSHDRIVALCRVAGRDLAAILVARGLARDCPRFSGGRYEALERAAAAAGAAIGATYRLPGYCRG